MRPLLTALWLLPSLAFAAEASQATKDLRRAAEKGDAAAVAAALQQGGDPNAGGSAYYDDPATYLACRHAGLDVVRLLLDKGGDLFARSSLDRTCLSEAAERKDLALLDLLLERKPDLARPAGRGEGALAFAASAGNVAAARKLLDAGAAAGGASAKGRTPLHAAAGAGSVEVVKLLLERGAPVDPEDANGSTPLKEAAQSGSLAVVKLLVEKGASPAGNGKSARYTAWHVARRANQKEVAAFLRKQVPAVAELVEAAEAKKWDLVRKKLEAGADANLRLVSGVTLLGAAVEAGQFDLARLLVRKGAEDGGDHLTKAAAGNQLDFAREVLDQKVAPPASALFAAAERGHLEMTRLLLDRGAEKNATRELAYFGIRAQTVLMATLEGGDFADVAKLLLERGADVHAQDGKGRTALHVAAEKDRVECFRALLAAGANLEEGDAKGETPKELAGRSGVKVRKAIERMENPSLAVADAIEARDLPGLRKLLAEKADPNVKVGALSALSLAIRDWRDLEVVTLLLDHGARPDPQALADAINASGTATLELLLARGADPTAPYNGWTSLALAAKEGREDAMRVLLAKGVGVNARDQWGRTPLYIAVWSSRPGAVKLLLEAGADPSIPDSNGKLPKDLADRTSKEGKAILKALGAAKAGP